MKILNKIQNAHKGICISYDYTYFMNNQIQLDGLKKHASGESRWKSVGK